MKILVICQHYYPEPFRITDICEALVQRGYEVTVVTGIPNYPMGTVYPGYEKGKRRDETINGVKVHHCPIHPRKTGVVHRVWNYFSYPRASSMYIDTLDDTFDVVFINQLSPVMMAQAGLRYAKKHKKKAVLYCLDLWPASLGAGGLSKGIIFKLFHWVSRQIYRRADKILITSRSFADYFAREFGIFDTIYLPQYAEESFTPEQCRKTPNDTMDLMFAGNVGAAQSVETIIRAADLCKDVPELRWHIVGDGTQIDACRALAKELDAPVIFHGRKPLEEMPQYYAMADAMLVTMQNDPVISLTLPGKVQTYMAAGKPVLGAINGETQQVIKASGCGLCANAEDAEGLALCVRRFLEADRETMAANARAYFEKNFEKQLLMDRFQQSVLEELT